MDSHPSLSEIETAHRLLAPRVLATPILPVVTDRLRGLLPAGSAVTIKLELYQHTGSFKARGALLNVLSLDEASRRRGVTAVSAGNHAIALAWAAKAEGVSAKVVMMASADPVRVAACKALGAEVVQMPDVNAAFVEVERIRSEEGRAFVHPFEGKTTATGTATLGLELMRQAPDLEAIVIPVGGGGLIAGMARAVKLMSPACAVYGVEPEGADNMWRSFRDNAPAVLEKIATIADSLAPPRSFPYSYGLARAHVDEIVRIPDSAMLQGMVRMFDGLKLVVEPAGAASLAAIMGPLRERLAGKRIGIIACGSNIGEEKYARYLAEGRQLLAA